MISKKILGVIFTRSLLISLSFTVVQQIIVASSTLWIIKLSESAVSGENILFWLGLFVSSLFIVYLPSSAATCYLSNAHFDSFQKYVGCFNESFQGKAQLRSSVSLKNAKQPFLNSEAWLVIGEAHRFISDCLSITLNVVLNVIILGFVLNVSFLWAYLLVIPLVAFSVLSTKKRTKSLSASAQNGRTKLMQTLLPGWDSIFTGNSWNLEIWLAKFKQALSNARRGFWKSTLWMEIVIGSGMILSLVPILFVLVLIILKNPHNALLIVPVIATLPRQVLCIQYISDIIMYATRANALLAKLHGIEKAISLPESANEYVGKISWGSIIAQRENTSSPVHSFENMTQLSLNYDAGRITLRGKNGSGKSSFLAYLKEAFQEEAYLLPSHAELLFVSTDGEELSQGEKMMRSLLEIEQKVGARIILLDEWDANLDSENISFISLKIDKLAEKYCVIEARHRY